MTPMRTFAVTPRRAGLLLILPLALAAVLESAAHVEAAEVEVAGLNLSCGDSAARLEKSLAAAEGVTEIDVDQRTGTVTFQVPSPESVPAALERIQAVGLYGRLQVDGQPRPFPQRLAPEGTRARQARFTDVHLGCRSASDAVAKALESFETVATITCDPAEKIVLVEARGGAMLDVPGLQKALFAAGLNSKWVPDEE